jgi:membrane fusion protein (multidrug efflux system)
MKLFGIDQQQYQATYVQATANLSVAKANLLKVQQDVDRYQQLAQQDAVARQTLEHALADLQSAKMQVAAAEANVKSVQTNLRYSVITAPFDGVIGISLVKRGSAVVAGQTLLDVISSDDPMAVDCSVDEKEIGRYTKLMAEKLSPEDSTFTLRLPDGSLYQHFGQLGLLDRAVDAQTGTIRMRLIFSNPEHLLRPGMTCDARVRTTGEPGELLIPYRSVVEQMGEYFVFVLHGDTVSQRRLSLGAQTNGLVEVLGGLKAGDQIVTDGVQRLHDNAIVTVTNPSTNGAPEFSKGEAQRQESR